MSDEWPKFHTFDYINTHWEEGYSEWFLIGPEVQRYW